MENDGRFLSDKQRQQTVQIRLDSVGLATQKTSSDCSLAVASPALHPKPNLPDQGSSPCALASLTKNQQRLLLSGHCVGAQAIALQMGAAGELPYRTARKCFRNGCAKVQPCANRN